MQTQSFSLIVAASAAWCAAIAAGLFGENYVRFKHNLFYEKHAIFILFLRVFYMLTVFIGSVQYLYYRMNQLHIDGNDARSRILEMVVAIVVGFSVISLLMLFRSQRKNKLKIEAAKSKS